MSIEGNGLPHFSFFNHLMRFQVILKTMDRSGSSAWESPCCEHGAMKIQSAKKSVHLNPEIRIVDSNQSDLT
jgi:hypothetical protein